MFIGIQFISDALIIGSVLYVVIYICFLKKRKELFINLFWKYLLCIYILTILCITRVISKYGWCFNVGQVSLIPFKDGVDIKDILNIILFVPLGFLISINLKNKQGIKNVIVCFSSSLLIELVQFLFVGRLADITDVITNTFGGLIGYYIYKLFVFIIKKMQLKKNVGVSTVTVFTGIICFIFSFPIDGTFCLGDMLLYRIEKGRYLWLDNNKSIFDGRGVHITLIFGMIVCIFGILSSVKYKYCLWSKASGVINMLCMLFVIILFITQLL